MVEKIFDTITTGNVLNLETRQRSITLIVSFVTVISVIVLQGIYVIIHIILL